MRISDWSSDVCSSDLTYASQRPVLADVMHFLPATLQLAAAALVVMMVFSIPIGIWAARYKNSFFDHVVRLIATLGVSMPNFWLGFLLILVFSVHLGWLPPMGRDGWRYVIMPAVAVSFMSLAINARERKRGVLGKRV